MKILLQGLVRFKIFKVRWQQENLIQQQNWMQQLPVREQGLEVLPVPVMVVRVILYLL
jgi:hypothetical protein